jgi:hypothetical protein
MKKDDRYHELNEQEEKREVRRGIENSFVTFEAAGYWVRECQAKSTKQHTQRPSGRDERLMGWKGEWKWTYDKSGKHVEQDDSRHAQRRRMFAS